jgi:hypothetical protein
VHRGIVECCASSLDCAAPLFLSLFDQLPVYEPGFGPYQRDQMVDVDSPLPPFLSLQILKIIATPAWRHPGSFVTSVLAPTGAKVLTIRLVVLDVCCVD